MRCQVVPRLLIRRIGRRRWRGNWIHGCGRVAWRSGGCRRRISRCCGRISRSCRGISRRGRWIRRYCGIGRNVCRLRPIHVPIGSTRRDDDRDEEKKTSSVHTFLQSCFGNLVWFVAVVAATKRTPVSRRDAWASLVCTRPDNKRSAADHCGLSAAWQVTGARATGQPSVRPLALFRGQAPVLSTKVKRQLSLR